VSEIFAIRIHRVIRIPLQVSEFDYRLKYGHAKIHPGAWEPYACAGKITTGTSRRSCVAAVMIRNRCERRCEISHLFAHGRKLKSPHLTVRAFFFALRPDQPPIVPRRDQPGDAPWVAV
jgi:hypothetical protein